MATIFPQNFPKNQYRFFCDKCMIGTNNKKDFSNHLVTAKHKKMESATNRQHIFPQISPNHVCSNCNKSYSSRSGLWRHQKKCLESIPQENEKEKEKEKEIEHEHIKIEIETNEPDGDGETSHMKTMMMEMMKSNKDLQQILLEQNNTIIELTKRQQPNITNTNCTNNQFNLQFFLNEQCKDAMNIMDFVNSVRVQLTDLEKVGQLGYVDGICNIIVKNLKAMDIYKRPIHSSDPKREIIYVKDEDKWERENDTKPRLKRAIKHIAHKNSQLLMNYKTEHPDCILSESNKNNDYSKLMLAVYDNTDENESKIIKRLAKEVCIDKTGDQVDVD